MNRNNDVYQVLVTKGNLAVATAGSALESLAVGQIGAFNADTHLAVGAATSPMPADVYLAVGTDVAGTGALTDVRQSAGQYIPVKGVTDYTFRAHSAGKPMEVTVGNYGAVADTEYGVRVEFRNSRIYRIQGFNQFSKAYIVTTPSVAVGATTTALDPNTLTELFVNAINGDIAGLLVARRVARQTLVALTHGVAADKAKGDTLTAADLTAMIAYNKANPSTPVYSDFVVTSVPLKIGNFTQVNLGYHKLLETVLVTSLVAGFTGTASSVVSQYPAFEEGSSNNVKQKEYHASGWAGSGPYKLSPTTGTAKGNIVYLAVDGVKYDQSILQYTGSSQSGWLDYTTVLSTVIATPEADTVTRNSVATLLDAILAGKGFEALADDAAAANVNPAVVEANPASPEVDGIA